MRIPDKLNMTELGVWLIENREAFIEVSVSNPCRKWSKWVARNETPFPCACPTRNEDCIFAEVYYELSKVSKISNYEKGSEEALLDFHNIKDDDDIALLDWLKRYKDLHSAIYKFKDTINITKTRTPYEKLTITISFPNIIKDILEIYNLAETLVMNRESFKPSL